MGQVTGQEGERWATPWMIQVTRVDRCRGLFTEVEISKKIIPMYMHKEITFTCDVPGHL